MKNTLLTKPMATFNRRQPVLMDGMRAPFRVQAIRNTCPENIPLVAQPTMPPESQLRYPVLFAVLLLIVAMFTLNFIMQI